MKGLWIAVMVMFATQAQASVAELINAVKQNNQVMVQNLLKKGENVNATDKDGNAALHYAVAMDNAKMAEILLQAGADMNINNAKGWSPLKIAEQKKVPHVTEVLENALKPQPTTEKKTSEPEPKTPAAEPQEVKPTMVETVNKPTSTELNADELAAYKETVEQAKKAVLEANAAKEKAENNSRKLENELQKLQAEKKNLEKRLTDQEKLVKEANAKADKAIKDAKAQAEKAAKEKVLQEAKAKAEKAQAAPSASTSGIKSGAAKTADKKPQPKVADKKPQTPAKPSTLNPKITAGDEEIIYCLTYLGNDEGPSMKRAAAYFAVSATISEPRYQEIAMMADAYYSSETQANVQYRRQQCSKLIMPPSAAKQNQVIRSMNNAIGL